MPYLKAMVEILLSVVNLDVHYTVALLCFGYLTFWVKLSIMGQKTAINNTHLGHNFHAEIKEQTAAASIFTPSLLVLIVGSVYVRL